MPLLVVRKIFITVGLRKFLRRCPLIQAKSYKTLKTQKFSCLKFISVLIKKYLTIITDKNKKLAQFKTFTYN